MDECILYWFQFRISSFVINKTICWVITLEWNFNLLQFISNLYIFNEIKQCVVNFLFSWSTFILKQWNDWIVCRMQDGRTITSDCYSVAAIYTRRDKNYISQWMCELEIFCFHYFINHPTLTKWHIRRYALISLFPIHCSAEWSCFNINC